MDISIELCPSGQGRKRTVNKDNWKREKAKKDRLVHNVNCRTLLSRLCNIGIVESVCPKLQSVNITQKSSSVLH
ncbi:hypothetical protein MML48_2g00008463 [Holotrichia oblita]|uniref:Uncharacterized protein n=1 Tax=Holotrichia oblita TaxID=644536 RepID=A0ACB9TIB6_HOLOL|nr:hypothetical protein MML48_2g00008463 [Holotrichia oblita]